LIEGDCKWRETEKERAVEGREGRENEVRKKDKANLIWRGVGDDVQQSHIVLYLQRQQQQQQHNYSNIDINSS